MSARRGRRLRIAGGRLGGRFVEIPPGIRPSGGKLREALASIWTERLPGARILELYAGSGSMGLELMSRGALQIVFVEADARALETLRTNCRLLPAGTWRVVQGELPHSLDRFRSDEPFDLFFADPPYGSGELEAVLAGTAPLASPEAELALEHSRRTSPPERGGGWELQQTRGYGETALSLYRLRRKGR